MDIEQSTPPSSFDRRAKAVAGRVGLIALTGFVCLALAAPIAAQPIRAVGPDGVRSTAAMPVKAKKTIRDLILSNVALPRPSPRRVAARKAAAAAKTKEAGSGKSTESTSRIAKATASETAASAETVPTPTKRMLPPAPRSDDLARAIDAMAKNRWDDANTVRLAARDPLDRKILDWLLARRGAGMNSAELLGVMNRLDNWPNRGLIRIRAEQAFDHENPSPGQIRRMFSKTRPFSSRGKMLYAEALKKAGKTAEANAIVRRLWRDKDLSRKLEQRIMAGFGKAISAEDHHYRVHRLLYDEDDSDALRLLKYLPEDQKKLVEARVAVNKRSSRAMRKLNAVPQSARKDPGYIFSLIQQYRRSKKYREAARLMLRAPRDPARLIDPDEWWTERRLVSRHLLDLHDYKSAYRIAADHSATGRTRKAEAEFHAGWYALRFLKKPKLAVPHFEHILKISSKPLSQSRGHYWLGRALEALGQTSAARESYRKAARYGGTFYGQLAGHKLSRKTIAMPDLPNPAPATKLRFASNELVRAIRRLHAVDHGRLTLSLYLHLARALDDPQDLTLLAQMAERQGQHRYALIVGKIAALRYPALLALAYPTTAIPKKTKIASRVEMPMVYAIARQESAFNPKAVSHAGARGLLQLMPGTAKQVARRVKLPYSKSRLTRDPAYNATLGSAFLGQMLKRNGGSYIMTFAAYNAGPRRVDRWISAYGDPRSRKIDAVDWIERISISETRNYVQRISENLQVYRRLLDGKNLSIARDLRRGRPNR